MNGFYTFVLGWGIVIALFYASTVWEGSRTITYYILWLAIVLTLVTHADELATLIQGTGLHVEPEPGPVADSVSPPRPEPASNIIIGR